MRRSIFAQVIAASLVLGLVSQVRGAPGDVVTMAAPMLGADPPKGASLRDGDSSVSTQTGALQYSYPIDVPPGRLGNQPQLALSYSSQAPLYGGIATGWSLTIPEIQRDTSQGVLKQITLDSDDWKERTFLSTMAGSRPLVQGAEGFSATFRAQNDTTYTRYERMPQDFDFAWRAFASDGTTYFFGDTALVTGGVDEDRLPLTRTEDAFGNTVEYRWHRDGLTNELRILSIEYASNFAAGLPASARVEFEWQPGIACGGDTANAQQSYRTGEVEQTGGQRLVSITATAFVPDGGAILHTRVITLTYDINDEDCGGPSSDVRQLLAIQESAWGAATPRVDLPAVTFDYGPAARTTWEWADAGPWFPEGPLSHGDRFLPPQWPTVDAMFVDLDGDGLVDRLTSAYDAETCRVAWARNTGAGFAPEGNFPLPHLGWGTDETPVTGCSLNGQLTHKKNISTGPMRSAGQRDLPRLSLARRDRRRPHRSRHRDPARPQHLRARR